MATSRVSSVNQSKSIWPTRMIIMLFVIASAFLSTGAAWTIAARQSNKSRQQPDTGFNYPDLSSVTGLNLVGSAAQIDNNRLAQTGSHLSFKITVTGLWGWRRAILATQVLPTASLSNSTPGPTTPLVVLIQTLMIQMVITSAYILAGQVPIAPATNILWVPRLSFPTCRMKSHTLPRSNMYLVL